MYYYQWPYFYYYNQQPCYWGCTDRSQCKFKQQHQQYAPTYMDQQYVDPAYYQQYMDAEQFYMENQVKDTNIENKKEINPEQINQIKPVPVKNDYAHQVITKLENLQNKLEEMEKENEELKEKVQNIKPINIENINYKIQELTVEELSGSLNIGLSALTDAENLKKLLEEKGEIKFNDLDTEAMENMEEMEDFNGA
ncbi:hypothetical protein DS745_06705 [Anaerobacillus alkaliphilus]|uniref:Uncharacterized protein n=1 Tax=Anaerobacillus alkaliphilus TaxID=1548597 RepID=A0A4V1LGN1_9BACI|nr:spore germination protein GerPC [Anaerobacillus alkaliphilus]RXJ02388.1 hypothetical protein DS745_06705 [Anaerobacillus alkaliphilus]